MVIDYNEKNAFKGLASILEDYTEWFGQIALYVAYSGEEHIPPSFTVPRSFVDWLESDDVKNEINPSVIKPIVDMHGAMRGVALEIIENLKNNKKPTHQNFVEFKNLQTSFLASIRRLEKDNGMQVNGTDDLTGLRPAESIKADLDKEMERLSRNGNPFALVVVRIDSFQEFSDQQGTIKIVVENIKKSMRPFDDAYYLDHGEFLLSLKHADMVGAEAAVNRIQHMLQGDKSNVEKITISCCMSEPVTGDQITDLLENMQDDLKDHKTDQEAILKFLDISPLERFLGSQK